MFVVKRNGVFQSRAENATDAEEVVCDSGEVPELAWESIVPSCQTPTERLVWEYAGWTVERVGR